jgi:hypothetical protein
VLWVLPPEALKHGATTAVAGNGVDGDGARGVRESVGAKAIPISMATGVAGCVFGIGTMATRLSAAFGAAGDLRTYGRKSSRNKLARVKLPESITWLL